MCCIFDGLEASSEVLRGNFESSGGVTTDILLHDLIDFSSAWLLCTLITICQRDFSRGDGRGLCTHILQHPTRRLPAPLTNCCSDHASAAAVKFVCQKTSLVSKNLTGLS